MDKKLVSEVMRAMGSKGGKIGGRARMGAMSPTARQALAQKAAAESAKVRTHLYRRHEKICPFRKAGRSHVRCSCPIWLTEFTTKDGKRVRSRSLFTRDWQQAKERLAALGAGGPAEVIGPRSKLYRLHLLACPFKKLGRRHINCNCVVWADYYKDGKLRRLSLRTRVWEDAKELLAALEGRRVTSRRNNG